MNLEVWSVDAQDGEGNMQKPEPQRVERSHIELELHLEDWIANDPTLIAPGLTLVGRQISIHDGRLDLLAIDAQDHWVVIEIKPGQLDAGALGQGLYYAASLAHLGSNELFQKIQPGLGELGDAETLTARVKELLDGEDDGTEREIAVLLVGAGIHPGLARMNDFLGRYGVPISVVSFEVFGLNRGPKLLIRERIEEPPEAPRRRRRYTVEAIRAKADEVGVVEHFNRFVEMSERAGLAVQPQRASVRIAPQANRTRFLMYAAPDARQGGGLRIFTGPKYFAEFFQRPQRPSPADRSTLSEKPAVSKPDSTIDPGAQDGHCRRYQSPPLGTPPAGLPRRLLQPLT